MASAIQNCHRFCHAFGGVVQSICVCNVFQRDAHLLVYSLCWKTFSRILTVKPWIGTKSLFVITVLECVHFLILFSTQNNQEGSNCDETL